MGSFSLAHWAIVAIVVLVLFGNGKISSAMGDIGKGIKAFRTGISDADEADRRIEDVAEVSVEDVPDRKL